LCKETLHLTRDLWSTLFKPCMASLLCFAVTGRGLQGRGEVARQGRAPCDIALLLGTTGFAARCIDFKEERVR